MRFNPKARLDTGRVRDRGRGSGGSGGGAMRLPIPGGMAAGGGIGGVIIIILFLVLTQCVGNGGGLPSGQGGGGQPGGLALQHEPLDVRREVTVALEPVAAGYLHEREPPVVRLVGGLELVAQLRHPRRRHLEHLGEDVGVDGLLGDHQDRLEGPGGLGGHQPS